MGLPQRTNRRGVPYYEACNLRTAGRDPDQRRGRRGPDHPRAGHGSTAVDSEQTGSGARTTTRPYPNTNLNNQEQSPSTTGTYVAGPQGTTGTTGTVTTDPVTTDATTDTGLTGSGATTGSMESDDTMSTDQDTLDTSVGSTDTSLPDTGSELSLVGGFGLLALAAAAGLRLRR